MDVMHVVVKVVEASTDAAVVPKNIAMIVIQHGSTMAIHQCAKNVSKKMEFVIINRHNKITSQQRKKKYNIINLNTIIDVTTECWLHNKTSMYTSRYLKFSLLLFFLPNT